MKNLDEVPDCQDHRCVAGFIGHIDMIPNDRNERLHRNSIDSKFIKNSRLWIYLRNRRTLIQTVELNTPGATYMKQLTPQ